MRSMYEFMIQISQDIILPIKAAASGIDEAMHNNISSRRIKLDSGTAKKFVNKKLAGNWWKW